LATIETLTAKIHADSQAKAQEIIAAAEREARQIVDDAVAEAEKECGRILTEAKAEAERRREQMVLSQTLAVRDENLAAKGQAVDAVFADALSRLRDMPKEEYLAFLSRTLLKLDIDGQEILLPKKYGIADLAELNAGLKKAGKAGDLTLYQGNRDIPSGFILMKKGIEQNNTFEAMVDFYRYELEGEVLKTLYQ
jgi:V/A-type H+-transporting ATPase subunit E